MNSRWNVFSTGRVLCAFLCCFFATGVSAHNGVHDGLTAGLMHPVSGLDHVLAMIAVGIWSAMLGRPFIWVLPLVFPALMIVGGGFGVAGISLPLAEAIIGIFGVFHGYAHGIELPSAASPAAYAVGFLLTTVLLHLVGVSVGLLTQVPRGAALLRASGYVMAPAGAWLLLSAAHVL